MDLEVTVHRIGGVDGYPRKFGPQPVPVTLTSVDRVCIDGALTMSVFVRLEFSGWTVAGEGWLGCTLRLEDMNGLPLGTRPAMVYDGVSDVPTHTLFHPRYPDAGAFVVALRKVYL